MTKKSDVEFVEPRTSGNSSAFAEMKKRLHFNPAEAMIWLDDRRMVLMQVEALGLLRQELIESIGREAARGLLTRFGYSSGCRDAEVAVKINQQASPVDLLISGGDFHALQGVVAVELVHQEICGKTASKIKCIPIITAFLLRSPAGLRQVMPPGFSVPVWENVF